MNLKKHIPNFITLMNLLAGVVSIYLSNNGELLWAGYCLFIAALLDYLDGFTARLLNAKSEIGLQLDSLADVVSFGVAPGFIMFEMIYATMSPSGSSGYLPFIGFIIPLFSALRLAKFNIATNQTDSFIGMPTPAVGLTIAAFPIIAYQVLTNNEDLYFGVVTNPFFLTGTTVFLSLMMVSPLPMFALKFKSSHWKENRLKYLFAMVSLILFGWLGFAAVPFITLIYLLLSLITFVVCKK
jgi:CDP-diacylglycerol--serine O-phosphatidyltransferase